MRLFDHFDLFAPIYERVITSSISDELCELLAPESGDVILDAAGGTGRVAGAFQEGLFKVVVADFSLQMLCQAVRKNGLLPVYSPAEKLPFAGGTFDRIMMVDALHHVFDQAATADEFWRVLKPGGRIVIEEPDIANWAVKVVALGEKLAGMRSHFLNRQQIVDLFAGFGGELKVRSANHNVWVVIDKVAA